MVKIEEEEYGDLVEARLTETRKEATFYSDISGEELDPYDLYEIGDMLCSKEELMEELEVVEKEVQTGVCKCGETECYYEIDGEPICESCLDKILEEYEVTADSILDREGEYGVYY